MMVFIIDCYIFKGLLMTLGDTVTAEAVLHEAFFYTNDRLHGGRAAFAETFTIYSKDERFTYTAFVPTFPFSFILHTIIDHIHTHFLLHPIVCYLLARSLLLLQLVSLSQRNNH